MARSQNGWPVVEPDKIDRSPLNGHKYPNGVLEGDVYTAFEWLTYQLDKRVEKVSRDNGADDEWGYFVKVIEGSTSYSNHASGTAIDYNASNHAMGSVNTYSAADRAEIRQILREAKGIFRWGGDYSGRKDDMHFEIIGSRADVSDFVDSIKPQGRYKIVLSLAGMGLPKLVKGDNDATMAGYNYVTRAQLMLKYLVAHDLVVDGIYGNDTTAAVKKLTTSGSGSMIDLDEWAQLYGFGKVAS